MADIGSVWASGSWSTSAWAANTWANVSTAAATAGPVWAFVNGVATPPERQSTTSQSYWAVRNGVYLVPAAVTRPRSFTKD